MLDSDTAVRRYGLNTGLGCNVRLKVICSTSRNLHPLELGQNGANSRPQHFWFGRTLFHHEKVVHIGGRRARSPRERGSRGRGSAATIADEIRGTESLCFGTLSVWASYVVGRHTRWRWPYMNNFFAMKPSSPEPKVLRTTISTILA